MKPKYVECESNQCENIISLIPMFDLPSGFELFSLAALSQILSRPDQDIFGPSSYFCENFYELIFNSSARTFDMSGPFWRLIEKYDPDQNTQMYEYSDFAENATNNIFDLEYHKSESIKKAIIEEVFNRQALKFYGVDKDEKIIDKIQPPLAQNTIFYAKSSYMSRDIPKAICIDKAGQKHKSFIPALEHVWTIYRENNKYSLHIRFFNSIYIPYRPSDKALPVAVCYYPNTFIKQISTIFQRPKPKNASLLKQNLISFPTRFNSISIEKLKNILHSYFNSSEFNNSAQDVKSTWKTSFVELTKLSVFNSAVFARYFLRKKSEFAINFAVISIYPKAEWKKVNLFLSDQIKEHEYRTVKSEYSKFILWTMHAITILREKENTRFQNVLGLLTTTIPKHIQMINFTFRLYRYYYYLVFKFKKANDLLINISAIGNSVFGENIFYYIKNGKKVYKVNHDIKFDYGFDCLKQSNFTIPELVSDINSLFNEFVNSQMFSVTKKAGFSIDTDYIKTLLIPDVLSLIYPEFN